MGNGKYVAGFDFKYYHQSKDHIYFKGKLSDYIRYGPYHEQFCVVKVKRSFPPMMSTIWDKYVARLIRAEEMALLYEKFHPGIRICFYKLYPIQVDETSRLGYFVFGSGRAVEEYEWVLVSLYMKEVEPLTLNNPYQHEILSAFSHFTWHHTGGKMVLTGFKGHTRCNDEGFDLLLPTIHSKQKLYGDKDKGEEGIKRFFGNHDCTNLCRKFSLPKLD